MRFGGPVAECAEPGSGRDGFGGGLGSMALGVGWAQVAEPVIITRDDVIHFGGSGVATQVAPSSVDAEDGGHDAGGPVGR